MANTAFGHDPTFNTAGTTVQNAVAIWGNTTGTCVGNSTILVDSGATGRIGIAGDIDLLTLSSNTLTVAGATSTTALSGLNTQAAITIGPYNTSAGNTGEIRFQELAAQGSHHVAIKSPDALAASYTMTLPTAVAGGNCYVLKSTNGGVLSWGAAASGGVAACDNVTWTGNQIFNHAAHSTGGTSFHRVQIDNSNAITANSGTTGYISTLALCEPNITETGGTVTTTSVIFIAGVASEGTNNYSINSDAGLIRSGGGFMGPNGSAAANSYTFCGDLGTGMWHPGGNNIRIATNSIDMMNIHEGNGGWNIEFGDTGHNDGDRSMVLNQGCKDNIILALKSSDVEHTFTGIAEDDTFGHFAKMCGNTGGLRVESFNGTSSATMSMLFKGYAKDACTNKNASGHSPVEIRSAVSSGTGSQQYGDMNMFSIADIACGTVKFLVDLDGDVYYDGTNHSNFDVYCDAGLVRALSTTMSQAKCGPSNLVRSKWDDYVQENEQKLVELGILGDYVVGVPANKRGLINGSQLQRLHNGAIWQLYTQLMDTKEELDNMKLQLQALQEGR